MPQNIDIKRRRKKHNYLRDIILVLLGLGMVAAIFMADDRFDITPNELLSRKSSALVYFSGPLDPSDLGLTREDMQPVHDFATRNSKHFKQVEIHIERQDSYGGTGPDTELRFYAITRFHDGTEIKSVYTRSTLARLPGRIVWRLKEDMGKYFDTRRELREKKIEGFTNTM